jgi:hypothetical protein
MRYWNKNRVSASGLVDKPLDMSTLPPGLTEERALFAEPGEDEGLGIPDIPGEKQEGLRVPDIQPVDLSDSGVGDESSLHARLTVTEETVTRVVHEVEEHTHDHGDLDGLSGDDHSLYHNDTRGDARYYTQSQLDGGQLDTLYYTETELDGGQLDNRYFTEAEHLNSSVGGADASKPIKLDADGHVDASMINDADIDHGNITGVGADQHHNQAHDINGADHTSGPLSIANGGSGQTTQQAAIDVLTNVSAASATDVLTKDGSGNATFQPVSSSAPVGAKYIVQESDGTLTNEQSLGLLTSGMLVNTVAAGVGVLSRADLNDIPSHTTRHSTGGDDLVVLALDDISNVVLTGPFGDNEVLAYDLGTSKWINQNASEAGLAAASHSHVEADISDLDHYTTADFTTDFAAESLANLTTRAITDLSDVAAKSGSGTTAIFQTSPTLTTPTIAQVNSGGGNFLLDTNSASDQEVRFANTGAGNVGVQFDGAAYYDAIVTDSSSGGTTAIDWDTGNKHKTTLTENTTVTFDAPGGPCNLILEVVQDSTARTITWPATVKWPEGDPPTLSTGSGEIDIITFYYNGTTYYGGYLYDFST